MVAAWAALVIKDLVEKLLNQNNILSTNTAPLFLQMTSCVVQN